MTVEEKLEQVNYFVLFQTNPHNMSNTCIYYHQLPST